MSFVDQMKVISQYLIPQHGLSIAAGKLADVKAPWFKNWFITKFAEAYNIDMSNAIEPELTNYACFNDFFTRAIDMKSRPISKAKNSLCSPVDGAISQFGKIENGRIIQAKKHNYTTFDLLGGNQEMADLFEDGEFCTIYLAPKDYHRIHMPCAGKLTEMVHVPGKLFSVNPLTANNVPGLFARNERVIAYFDTEFGKLAMVAVGATIVGSVETVWAGTVTPPTRKTVRNWTYEDENISLKKGEEMGRFKLGSTVVLLMQKDNWNWHKDVADEADIKLGAALIAKK